MANTINVTLETGGTTVNVYFRGAVYAAGSDVTVIDGYQVTKGAGNVAPTIEVGDYIVGWDGDSRIAGKVTGLPYTDPGNISYAQNDGIL